MKTKVLRCFVVIALLSPTLFAQSGEARTDVIMGLLPPNSAQLDENLAAVPPKCGTSTIALAYTRWSELAPQSRAKIQQLLSRPFRQTSKTSPSGKFRIHYDTSGVHVPALLSSTVPKSRIAHTVEAYIDSVAAVFDYCWEIEVNQLGYRPPPADEARGGGPEYDVYVSELSSSEFGSTNWVEDADLISSTPNRRFVTYIIIDNDYLGYRTEGLDGLRVTAAHEFQHAIQIGGYGYWSDVPNWDFYFFELTATWMEDVVYTHINDYYFDVPIYFRFFRDSQGRPLSFTTFNDAYRGYERSLWSGFMEKRWGRDVMRELWEGTRVEPFLKSLQSLLQKRGTDIGSEFALFTSWNYFTADRADIKRYYPEGNHYPRFKPSISQAFGGSFMSISGGAYPLSSQLAEVIFPTDTVTAAITDTRFEEARQGLGDANEFGITFHSGFTSRVHQLLSKGLKAEFSVGDVRNWRVQYFESSTRSNAGSSTEASPNPLRLSSSSRLVLPVTGTAEMEGEIFLLSASLDLVYSGRYRVVEEFGKRLLSIPTSDLKAHISSGVYFVVAHFNDTDLRWKVAIIQ